MAARKRVSTRYNRYLRVDDPSVNLHVSTPQKKVCLSELSESPGSSSRTSASNIPSDHGEELLAGNMDNDGNYSNNIFTTIKIKRTQ